MFSMSKFCRQTKGVNLYRVTTFQTGVFLTQNNKQYQFLDNLNDIVHKLSTDGRPGVFDNESIVIQKYIERPISFKNKLVKIRMICVITSYSPLTV